MKPGRIVILLAGRHAGKKAIIVKQHDDGKKVSLSLSPF
jgi:ribosomal protein L14E/L6E/L27E